MKKQLINEAFRFQRLAGIITENEYMEKNTSIYESSLDTKEKQVYDDIVNTVNEDKGFIDKIKSYAKKGLITIGVLAALLGGPILSQNQKAQVIDTVKTEMPANTDADYMTKAYQASIVVKSSLHKDEVEKLAKEDAGVEILVKKLKNIDKLSAEEIVSLGRMEDDCQQLIDIQNTANYQNIN
jgi:hypothetical protein